MTDHGAVSFSHLAEVFELLGSGLILISSECIPLGTNMLFSSACVLTLSPVGGCALLVTTQEPGSTFQKKNPTKHLYLPHKAPLYCKLFRVTLQNVCTVPSKAHPEFSCSSFRNKIYLTTISTVLSKQEANLTQRTRSWGLYAQSQSLRLWPPSSFPGNGRIHSPGQPEFDRAITVNLSHCESWVFCLEVFPCGFPGNGALLCSSADLREPFINIFPTLTLQFVHGRVPRWWGRWRLRSPKLWSLPSMRVQTDFGGFTLATSLWWQNWEGMIWLHALVKSLRTKSINFSTLTKKRLAKPVETNWGAELS